MFIASNLVTVRSGGVICVAAEYESCSARSFFGMLSARRHMALLRSAVPRGTEGYKHITPPE